MTARCARSFAGRRVRPSTLPLLEGTFHEFDTAACPSHPRQGGDGCGPELVGAFRSGHPRLRARSAEDRAGANAGGSRPARQRRHGAPSLLSRRPFPHSRDGRPASQLGHPSGLRRHPGRLGGGRRARPRRPCVPDSGSRRLRSLRARRHGGGQGALSRLAQHQHLRAVRLGHGGREPYRPDGGRGGVVARQCGNAIVRPVGVPLLRRDEQASPHGKSRGIRRPGVPPRQGRLHRCRAHPRRREGVLRRALPRPDPRSGHRRARRAVGAHAHIDQALAVLPPYAPGDRCGDRPSCGARRRSHTKGDRRSVSSRARRLRPAHSRRPLQRQVLAAALRRRRAAGRARRAVELRRRKPKARRSGAHRRSRSRSPPRSTPPTRTRGAPKSSSKPSTGEGSRRSAANARAIPRTRSRAPSSRSRRVPFSPTEA